MSKRWFTLVELIIVVVIIAVGLMAVVEGISRSIGFLNKTRNEVVAINLAREGMEAMYNIRNTNRLRRSWAKDACRLATDPMDCTSQWMGTWEFIIVQEWGVRQLSGADGVWDSTILCLQDDAYRYNAQCPVADQSIFRRVVVGKWLYHKESGNKLTCTGSGDTDVRCTDDSAKEYRFCTIVTADASIDSQVELCGAITNFEE